MEADRPECPERRRAVSSGTEGTSEWRVQANSALQVPAARDPRASTSRFLLARCSCSETTIIWLLRSRGGSYFEIGRHQRAASNVLYALAPSYGARMRLLKRRTQNVQLKRACKSEWWPRRRARVSPARPSSRPRGPKGESQPSAAECEGPRTRGWWSSS